MRRGQIGAAFQRARLYAAGIIPIAVIALGYAGPVKGQGGRGPVKSAPGRAAAPADGGRDISGFWELSFDSRKVPAASLLPTVTAAKIEAHKKADAKAIRWCN